MIPGEAFNALCGGAREAFADAWISTFRNFGANPGEVAHVYEFVRTGTPDLMRQWGPVLAHHGLGLRVTGVFCHQTPKARFNNGTALVGPELADLLIVHEHQWQPDRAGKTPPRMRRAVLVQAKMTKDGVCGTRDPDQEFLYQHWPDFELVGRGPKGSSFLKGPRDLRPNPAGARYGLIAKDRHVYLPPRRHLYYLHPWYFPWWFADPQDDARTAGAEDAGAFVANMLFKSLHERGRGAGIPSKPLSLASRNDHFDVTVEELLTVTAAKTLRYKDKRISGPRGVACFQNSFGAAPLLPPTGVDFHRTAGGGDSPPEEPAPEDEFDDGISLLLIETGGETRRELGTG